MAVDWQAVEGATAIITLVGCAAGQLWLSARRAGTIHQKLADIARKVDGHDGLATSSLAQRADHERRITELEQDIGPLKMTRDQFLELRGQSRAEHIAQNKTLEEIKAQIKEMGTTIGSRLDSLQRQVTNIVMGSADQTEEVLPHPMRRRGGRRNG